MHRATLATPFGHGMTVSSSDWASDWPGDGPFQPVGGRTLVNFSGILVHGNEALYSVTSDPVLGAT